MKIIHCCAILLCAFATITHAQTQPGYPKKPIRLIIPLAAGSAVDNAARIVTTKMAQNMGQAFVIENLPGAAGLSGADKVAKAASSRTSSRCLWWQPLSGAWLPAR